MRNTFLSELIPNDIVIGLEKILSDFFGSEIRIANDRPENMTSDDTDTGIIVQVTLNGNEAGYLCAPAVEPTTKNTVFLQGIAKVLSKLLYYRYLQSQRTETMEKNLKSQAEFMTQFADDVKSSISEMVLHLSESAKEDRCNDISKSIDILMASTLKLGNMIEENQDYVGVISGVFELNEAVYDIKDVVENQISRCMEKAAEKNDTLTYTIADDVPARLMGDPGHVGTILEKLLENSIRFTENSFVNANIFVEKTTYGCILVIRVSDGGMGIDPKQAEYIKTYMESRGFSDVKNEEFEMLGFSLIGFCVNAMSGSIKLDSEEGKGTVFEIHLPQLPVNGGEKSEF